MVEEAKKISVLAISTEHGDNITKTIRCLSLNAIPDEMLGRESEIE